MKHDVSNNYIKHNDEMVYIGDVVQFGYEDRLEFNEMIIELISNKETKKIVFKYNDENKKEINDIAFNLMNELVKKRGF